MRFWNLLLLLLAGTVATAQQIKPGKYYDRVVIVVMENQDYSDVEADPYYSTIAENHNGKRI